MKRSWIILTALVLAAPMTAVEQAGAGPGPAQQAAVDPVDKAAPAQEWRFTRDLEASLYGRPTLAPQPGRTGDMLLAAAALGGFAASSGGGANVNARDYDALYSLLQRYRDELVKMGLDHDQLMSQLQTLREQAADLKARLDKLHPKDGVKMHGRLYSYFDDLHIVGNRALGGPSGAKGKPAGEGIRWQTGVTRADLEFTFTRGLFSALAEWDLLAAWGTSNRATSAPRRLYMEMRTPIAFQFGDIDVNNSRLTLWRNEEQPRFEPEPFNRRRERIREDYDLDPNKWRVRGVRMSTDLRLFDKVDLQITNLTSISGVDYFASGVLQRGIYQTASGVGYYTESMTFLDSWSLAVPTNIGLTLSYHGNLFWDVPNTIAPKTPPVDPLAEMVNSGRVRFKKGMFFADLEFAVASYTPSRVTYAAQVVDPVTGDKPIAEPITGTAMVVEAGVEGKWGFVRLFGGQTSETFHAAGAQGRTRDNGGEHWTGPGSPYLGPGPGTLGGGFYFLGPFETDIAQLGPSGFVGAGSLDAQIPLSFHTQWNTSLIPPGFFTTLSGQSQPFQHLLTYSYLDQAQPYGPATPNRQGFGAAAEFNLFDGVLKPMLGYQSYQQIKPVATTHTASGMAEPFSYSQIQAGTQVNFKLIWPVLITAGYTMRDAKNGENTYHLDINGDIVPFGLSSSVVDLGLMLSPSETLSIALGMRHMDATGVSDVHLISFRKGVVYDMFGYGIIWDITDSARLDLLYENQYFIAPETPGSEYEQDTIHARVTVSF